MKQMKKFLAIITVLFTVILSSCSNDDLPLKKSVTFKINPSTVVSSLLERNPGDLSSISKDKNLHVNLYIYNEAGNLVAKDVQMFKDYTHIMTSTQNIDAGNYIVVVSTQIIGEDGFKYWEITGTDKISDFMAKDAGYIGGSSKILGLTAQKISISPSTKEVSIDVKCAGSVALVEVLNWNRYSNIETFELVTNKSCDDVKLDYDGGLNYSIESSSGYKWLLTQWNYDSQYNGASGYTFMFPCTNVKMTFAAEDTSGELYRLGEEFIGNIKADKTYWFAYDVQEDKTYWADASDWDTTSNAPIMRAKNNSSDNLLEFNSETKTISIKVQ